MDPIWFHPNSQLLTSKARKHDQDMFLRGFLRYISILVLAAVVFLQRSVTFSFAYSMFGAAVVSCPLSDVLGDDHPSGCFCVQVQQFSTSILIDLVTQLVPITSKLCLYSWLLLTGSIWLMVWFLVFPLSTGREKRRLS